MSPGRLAETRGPLQQYLGDQTAGRGALGNCFEAAFAQKHIVFIDLW